MRDEPNNLNKATESTEDTEMKRIAKIFHVHLMGAITINRESIVFSVNSVFSVVTTSHSTKLPKDASQVAGYVANSFL